MFPYNFSSELKNHTLSKTVSHKNGFVNYDFQQLTLILGFCAPKNGNNGFFPKSYCFIE